MTSAVTSDMTAPRIGVMRLFWSPGARPATDLAQQRLGLPAPYAPRAARAAPRLAEQVQTRHPLTPGGHQEYCGKRRWSSGRLTILAFDMHARDGRRAPMAVDNAHAIVRKLYLVQQRIGVEQHFTQSLIERIDRAAAFGRFIRSSPCSSICTMATASTTRSCAHSSAARQ